MELINIYSLYHFILWTIFGKYISNSWPLFFVLSLGWEVLELFLPFTFAIEIPSNKVLDIIVNCIGFYLGATILNNEK